jgi:hypothetical protein
METRKNRGHRNRAVKRPSRDGKHTRVPASVNVSHSIDYWVAVTRAHSA